jgi:FixJ family two-component response regulator
VAQGGAMHKNISSSQHDAVVCVIQANPIVQKQLDVLLAYLDSPILSFKSSEQFLQLCAGINVGCILLDGDQLGDDSHCLLDELSRMGLSRATIIMAQHANIDAAVKALQSGIADYLEMPQPDRVLLAKICQVMGDFRSVDVGKKS